MVEIEGGNHNSNHSMCALRQPYDDPGQPVGSTAMAVISAVFTRTIPSENTKLVQAATPIVHVTVTVTDSSVEEMHCQFSRAELENRLRRWDFDENECVCLDLLSRLSPGASHWSQDELAEEFTKKLLVETDRCAPKMQF